MFRWLMLVGTLCLVVPEGLFAQTSDRSQALAQRVAAFEFEIERLAEGSLVPAGLRSNTVLPVGELPGRTERWLEGNLVAQAGTSTKSPVLAAGLSLVLPVVFVNGIGSYYAGNSGHGTRHLLIGFGSAGLMLAGLSSCDDGFNNCSAEWVGGIGAVAYLGNWLWGTITAGLDAGEYNRRQSETRAARLEPGFKILTAFTLSPSTAPERHRLGLQVARLAF